MIICANLICVAVIVIYSSKLTKFFTISKSLI